MQLQYFRRIHEARRAVVNPVSRSRKTLRRIFDSRGVFRFAGTGMDPQGSYTSGSFPVRRGRESL